jgi:hypothetical protein
MKTLLGILLAAIVLAAASCVVAPYSPYDGGYYYYGHPYGYYYYGHPYYHHYYYPYRYYH